MIDITKFCGKGDIRSHLNAPFIINKRLVASDGRVMIAVQNDMKSECPKCHVNEPFERVIKLIESASAWYPAKVGEIIFPEMAPCWVCKSTGKAKKEQCKECCGEGTVDAETDYSTYYDLECASCKGVGYECDLKTDETCQDCNGLGKVTPFMSAVEILGVNVQVKYLSLIIEEENLEFAAVNENGMLAFRIGADTIGAIMCCRV